MSMRVERSSLDQVKKRFEVNKKKLEEKQKEYDFEERMKELREEVSVWASPPPGCRDKGRMRKDDGGVVVLAGGESKGLQEGEAEGAEAAGGGGRGLRGGRRDGCGDGFLRLRLVQEESLTVRARCPRTYCCPGLSLRPGGRRSPTGSPPLDADFYFTHCKALIAVVHS